MFWFLIDLVHMTQGTVIIVAPPGLRVHIAENTVLENKVVTVDPSTQALHIADYV